MKTIHIILAFVQVLLIAILCTSCFPSAASSIGTPAEGEGVWGMTLLPQNCFPAQMCDTTLIDAESFPLPAGTVLLFDGGSGLLTQRGETGCDGSFAMENPAETASLLFVFQENIPENTEPIVLKKAFSGHGGDIGMVNAYTTTQVIIWEQANILYGEGFVPFDPADPDWTFDPPTLALAVADVPLIIPTESLVKAVEKALQACQNPQRDTGVITQAQRFAREQFGSPAHLFEPAVSCPPRPPSPDPDPGITLTKTADTPCALPEVTFTITLTNTGNVTLVDVILTDSLLDIIEEDLGTLAPGESIQKVIKYKSAEASLTNKAYVTARYGTQKLSDTAEVTLGPCCPPGAQPQADFALTRIGTVLTLDATRGALGGSSPLDGPYRITTFSWVISSGEWEWSKEGSDLSVVEVDLSTIPGFPGFAGYRVDLTVENICGSSSTGQITSITPPPGETNEQIPST